MNENAQQEIVIKDVTVDHDSCEPYKCHALFNIGGAQNIKKRIRVHNEGSRSQDRIGGRDQQRKYQLAESDL